MNIESILVPASARERDMVGVRVAGALAAAHSAHLIGLHVIDIPSMPANLGAQFPAELYQIQRDGYLAAAATARERFERACETAGVKSEWRCVEGRAQAVVETHARCADLLCMTGPQAGGADMGSSSLCEALVLSSGKPVLMCPASHTGATLGEHVAIAWDGSREAARAVSDAMGILQAAGRVSVVSIQDHREDEAYVGAPGADLVQHLARHDVGAQEQSIPASAESVATSLLGWVDAQRADLLVMGGYGHSRFREILLGGVTRHVLTHATIPTLMSH